MKEFKTHTVLEQSCVHDGPFTMAVSEWVLMTLVNGNMAQDELEKADFDNPRRYTVRVIVDVREDSE